MSIVMDVLDRHVELATWADSDDALPYLDWYLEQNESDILAGLTKHQRGEHVEGYRDALGMQMGLAETFWVSPDMTDVVEAAADSVDPLRREHVPSRHGFIQFARTVVLGVDEHDEPWGFDGFSWSLTSPKNEQDAKFLTTVVWYDGDNVKHESEGIVLTYWRDIREEAPGAKEAMRLPWAFPGQITGWAFDIPWADERDRSQYTIDAVGERQRKVVLATFRLLLEEITIVKTERAPRAAIRRASRSLKTVEYGDVRVIELRKVRVLRPDDHDREQPDLDERFVWSHRWIVPEFKRDSYHPSCPKCKALRRACKEHPKSLVHEHVRGPEHMPIIQKDRLHILKR